MYVNILPNSTYKLDMIQSIAIFYVFVFSTFIFTLFTCSERDFIMKNKTAQYVIGFFCFFFLVTLFSKTNNAMYEPPFQKLIKTFLYYIVFILSTRLDYRIMVIVLILIFVNYLIQLNEEYYKKLFDSNKIYELDKKNNPYYNYDYWITLTYPIKIRFLQVKKTDLNILNKINNYLYYIIIVLVVFGFICYGGEMKETIKNSKNFTWTDVIYDNKDCKLKNSRKSLLYYFKKGLNIFNW